MLLTNCRCYSLNWFLHILVDGHVPTSMLELVMVPIVKTKSKRITDKDNYRPICESANQFGIKSKLGTDMCVFILKAFDQVNHSELFTKPMNGSSPKWIVRVLC